MAKEATVIYSDRFEKYTYGPEHPFRLDRGKIFIDLAIRFDILNESMIVRRDFGDEGDIRLFHTEDYIEALRRADNGEVDVDLLRYGLGFTDNPIFKGIFEVALLHSAMAREAYEQIKNFKRIFVPVGGLHHAMRDRASGFCYINDIGILIEMLLREGRRVFYIDIDAHHGDGIQNAFYEEPKVLKMSFHESGRTLFPYSGFEDELGSGEGKFYNLNIPLSCYSDDEVFLYLFKNIFTPIIERFNPDVTVAQIGVDMMSTDPLTHLRLTNNAYIEAIRIIKERSKALIAFGGGGYNADNIARGYTLAWATLNDVEIDDYYSLTLGGSFMGIQDLSISSLKDMNLFVSGPEKEIAIKEAERIYKFYKENVFPFFGIT